MRVFERRVAQLKVVRTVLVLIAVVWLLYGLSYVAWGRPLAGSCSLLIAVLSATLAFHPPRDDVGWQDFCYRGLAVSTLGFLVLSLLSGQGDSPHLWMLATVPAYAFCFLGFRESLAWTGLSLGSIITIHLSGKFYQIPKEFWPSGWELCGYQLLLVTMMALVSGAVKSLSYRHVSAMEEARREAELSASARSRFTAHVSHEMRHPLQSIVGALELVPLESLPGEERDLIVQARRDANLLTNLVHSTLLFTDLNEGRFVASRSDFFLEELSEGLKFRFGERFADRGVELKILCPGPLHIECERSVLEHVLTLLLDNAHKYTSREDRVTVEFCRVGDDLQVNVVDTGVGIPEDALELIREPFRRAENLPERKQRGFGLGLAIVDQLVEKVRGTWGVESRSGEGSRFWLRVPCQWLSADQERELGPLRIMVVDDDPICLTIARRLLIRLGHQVTICSGGVEALERASAEEFDLIFMDCQMPEWNGFETTVKLRRQGFLNPIVALTANTAPEDCRQCIESGMSGVLAKPATLSKLKRVLQKHAKRDTP